LFIDARQGRKKEPWRNGLSPAFGEEAARILKAQQKGLAFYPGGFE
jgi:hypothetical protein